MLCGCTEGLHRSGLALKRPWGIVRDDRPRVSAIYDAGVRALLTAAALMIAGCSTAGQTSQVQKGPISQADQGRLLAECESIFRGNGQTTDSCPNIVEGTVWEAENRGCGYAEALKFIRSLLRVPGESESGDDLIRGAQAGLPESC